PVHRPGRRPGGRPALVRPSLARRNHLRGSPPAPRPGNPAAMVGPGHPAHNTGAARLVLARDALGNADRSHAAPPARVRPLVPEKPAPLPRRPAPPPAGTAAP